MPNSGQEGSIGLALSPTGRLLVSGFNSAAVYEYAKDAAGAWGLLHTISGSATGLIHPAGVAFGPGGTVVVANDVFNGDVLEFAPDADGNAAPVRTLAGAATALNEPLASPSTPRARSTWQTSGTARSTSWVPTPAATPRRSGSSRERRAA